MKKLTSSLLLATSLFSVNVSAESINIAKLESMSGLLARVEVCKTLYTYTVEDDVSLQKIMNLRELMQKGIKSNLSSTEKEILQAKAIKKVLQVARVSNDIIIKSCEQLTKQIK
jgi:hypothetical protein